jgi:type II secretory pathway component PulK
LSQNFRNEFYFVVSWAPDSLQYAPLQLLLRPNELSLDQAHRVHLGGLGLAHRRLRPLQKESFCHRLTLNVEIIQNITLHNLLLFNVKIRDNIIHCYLFSQRNLNLKALYCHRLTLNNEIIHKIPIHCCEK